MAEILKEWLSERLQRPITWEAESFGKMMQNGYVIAGLLLSYGVINEEEHFLIRSGNDRREVQTNWEHITQWLKGLDIYLNDGDCESLMAGNSSFLLRLFYQLFLHLDKRDRTDFIKLERKMVSSLVEKLGHRFKVNKIPEEVPSTVDDLSRPLLNEQLFIDWQRKKAEQVQDKYDYMRHKYAKVIQKLEDRELRAMGDAQIQSKLTNKEREMMETFAIRHPCKFENYTYDQLVELENKTSQQRVTFDNYSEWSKNYMKNLSTKLHNKSESIEQQKDISKIMSSSVWNSAVAEEEVKVDNELAKNVMKLSQFEKQMCTQIMETKQQARNLFRNRELAAKEYSAQRLNQLNQFFDNVKNHLDLEVEEINFENNRQQMLHKKLYAEKMKRKRQHYYEICYETVLSIVDYATKQAYFQKLIEDTIPDHFIMEWKKLYFKMQPIFDILEPLDDVLKDVNKGNEPEEQKIEEIIRLELDRQEALNDAEFIEYNNYTGPWNLDMLLANYEPDSADRRYEYLGLRILGHVVFTLLAIKYPFPPPQSPAVLPEYKAKTLLRCLPDKSLTVPMQILLNHRKIHVVRLETAINFCLRKFKDELVGMTDIELSFDKFTQAAAEEEDKELIRLIKLEDDATYKPLDLSVQAMLGATLVNVKQTQTPKTLPEEEITLSEAAALGKYTYESLNAGDSLTDYLVAAMIVAYLKDQDDIKGFVLINYPNSYREARILEKTFLGRAPPSEQYFKDRDDIYLDETIVKHREKDEDECIDVRISRLVINPHKNVIQPPFQSYFTSYINLKLSDDLLQEVFVWDLDEENSELIDRFYAVLGLNYSLYYEIFDKDLLVQLCTYIIGDMSVPMQSTDSLFGEGTLEELEFTAFDERKFKTKLAKQEISTVISKGILGDDYAAPNSTIADISPEEVAEELVEESQENIISLHEEIITLLAGEEDWDYGKLPISPIIGLSLANCWEEIEKNYIHDMKILFFAIRLQINSLIPYARYIRDKMEQIITLPSHKQDLVASFQDDYNNFENDWRDINVVKNEWHCRIKELQKKLYDICDERKLFAEAQRKLLILDGWAMDELTSMTNTYTSCMQAELNRFVLTYQMLHDFYLTMLKQQPPYERLASKDLNKITREGYDESPHSAASKKSADDKIYRQLKAAYQDLHLKNIEINFTNNPFNYHIENNVKFALKTIKEMNDSFRTIVTRECNDISKIQPTLKKKDENTSEEEITPEEIHKINALKCCEEWMMGINGEASRAILRITALQQKCYHDMKMFNDHIYNTFMKIQGDIDTYYLNEIRSVDRLCERFQMAVEAAKHIPERLILEHDKFIIDPDLVMFSVPKPIKIEEETEQINSDVDFKIWQLAALRAQFNIVAPTGIILKQNLVYLLQDFIFFGKESSEGLFPPLWNSVDAQQVPKLVYILFGDTVYIDWRDFLIYCLNIRFATTEELLKARSDFRHKDVKAAELISRADFLETELWYESDFDVEDKYEKLRKCLVKNFLFELFETKEDVMNYSAFLLAFCKNINAIEGFVMALSMAVGKKTCHLLDDCEEVVCNMIKAKKIRDINKAHLLKCVGLFLDTLINKVMNICEYVHITEMQYEPPADKSKGKGKGAKPTGKGGISKADATSGVHFAKKAEAARRASEPKTPVTFICPPCEHLKKEEKPQEKIEKEETKEPQPDPNLVYTVSQAAIWNVLKICLPWHFVLLPEQTTTPYVQLVTDLLKRFEVETDNGDIYVCRFMANKDFSRLLEKVKKFNVVNFGEALRSVATTYSVN